MDQWLAKINGLKNWQATLIIAVVGLAVFSSGLSNQFLGDDSRQIVNNPVVHSISHLPLFFEGSTFYVGKGIAPLYGIYYRPLMTTVFSLIYTVFGAHAFFFHLFQLLLCIGSAVTLYLFLRFSFTPILSLLLSLIFLVHPLDSQVVFALASMQDALFFFFGILALYLLVKYSSIRSLLLVALCLFLALLSKEAGVYFIAICALFLVWYDRKRLAAFIGIMVVPVALYLALKINAIGLIGSNPGIAPIDKLSLGARLLNAPIDILFYLEKLIFPWNLASGYYWVYSTFSISHVLVPLVLDLLVLASLIYVGYLIKQKTDRATFYKYLFFGAWACVGLFTVLQIIPVDLTVSETWFYFSMAGVLGMVGIIVENLEPSEETAEFVILYAMIGLIVLLGIRTALRGPDWRNINTLAHHDIATSKEDYLMYGIEAANLNNQGKYQDAINDAQHSVDITPSGSAYYTLCTSYFALDQEKTAEQDCLKAIHYTETLTPQDLSSQLYNNTAALLLRQGSAGDTLRFVSSGLKIYPQDSDLWLYQALLQYTNGEQAQAKVSIANSVKYGQNSRNSSAYDVIMNNKPLKLK